MIIGENGAGKSTVLEGIAMILYSFTSATEAARSRRGSGGGGRVESRSQRTRDIKAGDQIATVSAKLQVREREETFRELQGPPDT